MISLLTNILIPSGRPKRLPLVIIVTISIATFTLLISMLSRTHSGIITISEPDVYTRERLVNDRFREEYWLRKKLDEVDDIARIGSFSATVGLNRNTDTTSVRSLLSLRGPNPSPGARPTPPAERSTEPNSQKPSIIEQFRDIMQYRNEIRSELIVTQLDDRHDIGGHTLIRLDFDASLIPGPSTTSTALILARLKRIPAGTMKNLGITTKIYDEWTAHLQATFDATSNALNGLIYTPDLTSRPTSRKLFDNFTLFLQRDNVRRLKLLPPMQNEYASIIYAQCQNELTDGGTQSTISLDNCIAERLSEQYYKLHQKVSDTVELRLFYDSMMKTLELPIEIAGGGNSGSTSVTPSPPAGTTAAEASTNAQTTAANDRPPKEAPNVPPPKGPSHVRLTEDMRNELSIDLQKENNRDLRAIFQAGQTLCEPTGRFRYPLLASVDSVIDDYRYISFYLPCPNIVPEHLRRLQRLVAFSSLMTNGNGRDDRSNTIVAMISLMHGRTLDQITDSFFSVDGGLDIIMSRSARPKYMLEKQAANLQGYPEQQLEIVRRTFASPLDTYAYDRAIVRFLEARVSSNDPEIALRTKTGASLSQFVESEVEGCETGRCRLKFKKVLPCGEILLTSQLLRGNLDHKAGERRDISIYSVSPKQQVDQYAIDRATKQTFDLGARIDAGLSGLETGEATADLLRDISNIDQSLQRHPIIVGFGEVGFRSAAEEQAAAEQIGPDGKPPSAATSANDAVPDCGERDTKRFKDSNAVTGTTIGWALRAPLDPRQLSSKQHTAIQRTLTATVSVPAWWPALEVELGSCWLDEDLDDMDSKLARQDVFAFCKELNLSYLDRISKFLPLTRPKDEAGRLNKMILELPTSIRSTSEISRTIGIEVIREPYIKESSRDTPKLEIGRPGELLLEGGRLWRSTVVTLGDYQRADEIIVIPSMDGVIARFNCIYPPPDENFRLINVLRMPGVLAIPSSNQDKILQNPSLNVQSDKNTATQQGQSTSKQSVVVWTSEGKTDPIFVDLLPFKTFATSGAGDTEKLAQIPCWINPGYSESESKQ